MPGTGAPQPELVLPDPVTPIGDIKLKQAPALEFGYRIHWLLPMPRPSGRSRSGASPPRRLFRIAGLTEHGSGAAPGSWPLAMGLGLGVVLV